MSTNKKNIRKFFRIFFQVLLIVAVILYLFPIIWAFLAAFKTGNDTFAIPPKFIFKPTMEAFIYVIKEMKILYYLANSVIIASVSTVLGIVIAMFSAYALARYNWRGKENTAFFILTLKMMPPIAVILPMYLIYRTVEDVLKIHLIDTHIGLILLYLFFNIPFSIWILRGFFEKIPASIEESALIDGCSRFSIIFRIMLPMARPGIVATAFLNLIFSWNEFLFALILTDSTARTLPVQVAKLIGFRGILWNQMGAISIFCLVPIMIFVIFARNNLVTGLTMGSISGE